MTRASLVFWGFALLLAACHSAKDPSPVVQLDNVSFRAHVQQHKFVLVEFFAPWCGHCQALEPKFEAAAQLLQDNPDISLASLDATIFTTIATAMRIEGYPTLVVFVDGNRVGTYNGERTVDGIESFMRRVASGEVTQFGDSHKDDDEGSSGEDAMVEPEGSRVVEVFNPDEFDRLVSAHELVLVEFFAPWCGYCKALRPQYTEAAEELAAVLGAGQSKEATSDVVLAKVNGVVQRELVATFNVEGFPTLMLFRKGEPAGVFDGERTKPGIVKFMLANAMPSVLQLQSLAHLESLVGEQQQIAVVAFTTATTSEDDSVKASCDLASFFVATESQRGKAVFAIASDPAKWPEFGVSQSGVFVFGANIANPTVSVDNAAIKGIQFEASRSNDCSTKDLMQFVFLSTLPVFGELSPETFPAYTTAQAAMLLTFAAKEDFASKIVEAVAREVRVRYGVVSAFVDPSFGDHFQRELGIVHGNLPIALLNFKSERHYTFTSSNHTEEAVLQFVSDFANNLLQPHVRSAEPPDSNDGPVKIVVGSTFDSIVRNGERDVLLMLYAPWCPHCKAFSPMYERAAIHLANAGSDVIVAQMDVTENDVPPGPGFVSEGIPAVKFISKEGDVVSFDASRKLQDIIDFVHTHATTPFTKPQVPRFENDHNVEAPPPQPQAVEDGQLPNVQVNFESQKTLDELFDDRPLHTALMNVMFRGGEDRFSGFDEDTPPRIEL